MSVSVDRAEDVEGIDTSAVKAVRAAAKAKLDRAVTPTTTTTAKTLNRELVEKDLPVTVVGSALMALADSGDVTGGILVGYERTDRVQANRYRITEADR